MILYSPGIGGVHIFMNLPLVSLVTVPISCVLPLGSIAVSFTGTPVAFVGIGFCMYKYSIH